MFPVGGVMKSTTGTFLAHWPHLNSGSGWDRWWPACRHRRARTPWFPDSRQSGWVWREILVKVTVCVNCTSVHYLNQLIIKPLPLPFCVNSHLTIANMQKTYYLCRQKQSLNNYVNMEQTSGKSLALRESVTELFAEQKMYHWVLMIHIFDENILN